MEHLKTFLCVAVSQLSQLGTYAGNDAIVAFARLHQVEILVLSCEIVLNRLYCCWAQVAVVIHQPNTPCWQIKGWEDDGASKQESSKKGKKFSQQSKNVRQLHIAYHGGDHYDSVRRLGDTGHYPANILIDVEGNTSSVSYGQEMYTGNQEQQYSEYDFHEMDLDKLVSLSSDPSYSDSLSV